MPTNLGFETPGVALATRTLLLAGYIIENSQRQPTHIELLCQATSPLSAHISFLIAITDREQFSPELTLQLREVAGKQGRSLVLVAARTGEDCLGWGDFLDALGGPVASWRALSDEYGQNLVTASQNRNPPGVNGEAWRLFEDLVADGLEFCFGRKVRRLGARKRGQRVSDMITQIPDEAIVVVDAKAATTAFNAAVSDLRPLIEYTNVQRLRQRGHNDVFAALVVSSSFTQDGSGLSEISRQFLAEASVPVAFMTAATLATVISELSGRPDARNAIHWRRLLAGGLVTEAGFRSEFDSAIAERY